MLYLEYVQQIEHLTMSLDDIYQMLDERPIKRWCAMVHDKDILENGDKKPSHLHVEMEFYSSQTIETVSKWFNDKPQYFEKAKTKGKYIYNNMISYVFHLTDNADGKYKYSVDESKANFIVSNLIEKITNDVETISENKRKFKQILDDIMENKIPMKKLGNYLDNETWLKHKREIDNAYKIRNMKILDKMEENKDMKVIYIYGASGTGKTTYAKLISKSFGFNYYVSSSGSDPLGEYDSEECIIIDELRNDSFSYNELLKLLDNHTNSFVKSRYNNKAPFNCKLLIITSVLAPRDLYNSYELDTQKDSYNQLIRRIETVIKFNIDTIELYSIALDGSNYSLIRTGEQENPVKSIYKVKKNIPLFSNQIINSVTNYIKNEYKDDIKRVFNDENN